MRGVCSWVAVSLERARDERASLDCADELVQACREWACVRMLTLACAEGEPPFTVEAVLRRVGTASLEPRIWQELFDACIGAGLDSALNTHWVAAFSRNPEADLVEILDEGLPSLCWIDSVSGAFGVRWLVGTCWPHRLAASVVVPESGLYLWSGEGTPIPVPRWLMCFEAQRDELALFNGRAVGGWTWKTRGRLQHTFSAKPAISAPPYLLEPTWSTPAPVARGAVPAVERNRATVPAGQERVALPPQSAGIGERVVLRVLTGWDRQRVTLLPLGETLIVGRQGSAVNFVIRNNEVSRHHCEVRFNGQSVDLRDLGSTNGTRVGQRAIGRQWATCELGEVISLGKAAVVPERVTKEVYLRLQALESLSVRSPDRDPLTRLLLPRTLEAMVPHGAPMVLLYVERLASLHAQSGQAAADLVFHGVAREVQRHAERGLLAARVGYGEILWPLAEGENAKVVLTALSHAFWEAPISDVLCTLVVDAPVGSESVPVFLKRARDHLKAARARGGRGRLLDLTRD